MVRSCRRHGTEAGATTDDLKLLAPVLGFSGYQLLIRAYIGQGLRKDLARLEPDQMKAVAESLRRHGVSEQVIAEALAEARARR